MKLLTVALENFKYHKSIILDCQSKNLLIYGENGAGKTSIYKAIYSVFYHHKDPKVRAEGFRDQHINKKLLTESLAVKIVFDEEDKEIKRTDDQVTGREILKTRVRTNRKLFGSTQEDANIFMFEAKDLDSLLEGEADEKISKHFGGEYEAETIFRDLRNMLNSGRSNAMPEEQQYQKELRDLKLRLDTEYKIKIASLFDVNSINKILAQKFHWKEKVVFYIEPSQIDFSVWPYMFTPPSIKIFLENDTQETHVVEYLNEARIKVLALSIYLCGILKQPRKKINIIVLDDFVNSLDMANRRFIVDALVSSLKDYQFIILTHNIHFYELIKRVLYNTEQKDKWSYQQLVGFSGGSKFVIDKSNYLIQARERLDSGDYEAAANYLRKQFELNFHKLKEKLHLGKTEKINVLFNELKNGKDGFYEKPHELIQELSGVFKQACKSVRNSDFITYEKLEKKFQQKIEERKIIKDKEGELLIEINLIKDILLNPASHGNSETVVHKTECEYAYYLLEKLTNNIN